MLKKLRRCVIPACVCCVFTLSAVPAVSAQQALRSTVAGQAAGLDAEDNPIDSVRPPEFTDEAEAALIELIALLAELEAAEPVGFDDEDNPIDSVRPPEFGDEAEAAATWTQRFTFAWGAGCATTTVSLCDTDTYDEDVIGSGCEIIEQYTTGGARCRGRFLVGIEDIG